MDYVQEHIKIIYIFQALYQKKIKVENQNFHLILDRVMCNHAKEHS